MTEAERHAAAALPRGSAWAKNPQALAGRLRRAQTVVVPVVRLIGPR
jgi:hypothetical protein